MLPWMLTWKKSQIFSTPLEFLDFFTQMVQHTALVYTLHLMVERKFSWPPLRRCTFTSSKTLRSGTKIWWAIPIWGTRVTNGAAFGAGVYTAESSCMKIFAFGKKQQTNKKKKRLNLLQPRFKYCILVQSGQYDAHLQVRPWQGLQVPWHDDGCRPGTWL